MAWAIFWYYLPVIDRLDRLLTRDSITMYPAALLVSIILMVTAGFVLGSQPFSNPPRPLSVDLSPNVIAARLLLEGDLWRLYDPIRQYEEWLLLFNIPGYFNPFISLPAYALLFVPLALLPYPLAAAVWLVLTVLALTAALWLLRPFVPRLPFDHMLLICFSTYPAFELLSGGQGSALFLLIVVGALRMHSAGRPFSAGLLLGLLAVRPQLLLPLGLMLLARYEWRALAGMALSGTALALLSLVMVGAEGVTALVALLTGADFAVYEAAIEWKVDSVGALLSAVVPGLATPVTWAVAFAAVVITWRYWAETSIAGGYALALLLLPIVSPYFYVHNLVLLFLPALLALHERPSPLLRITLTAIYILLWTDPVRNALSYGTFFAAPWVALLLVLLWLLSLPLDRGRENSPLSAPSSASHSSTSLTGDSVSDSEHAPRP